MKVSCPDPLASTLESTRTILCIDTTGKKLVLVARIIIVSIEDPEGVNVATPAHPYNGGAPSSSRDVQPCQVPSLGKAMLVSP
jgi:hypothetical protein